MPKQHENDPAMSDGPIHQMSMVVGGLQADVKNLARSIENLNKVWGERDQNATEGRRALHEKFELHRQESGIQMAAMALRVDRLVDQVKIIEPSVTSFKEEKLRDEGAKRLGKGLIGAMITVAGGAGWGIHEFIGWIRHP